MIPRGNLETADGVLSFIDSLTDFGVTEGVTPEDVEDWYVGTYCNGREQGYSIIGRPGLRGDDKPAPKVCFSENRNSDAIVVYCGDIRSFSDIRGNVPDQEIWENRSLFGAGQYEEAARFILNYLWKNSL